MIYTSLLRLGGGLLLSIVAGGLLLVAGCFNSSNKDSEAIYNEAVSHASAGRNLEAYRMLRKAAELGHGKAMSDLGSLYSKGIGVSQDWEEAIKWWTKAVQVGDSGAIYNVGAYHYKQGKFNEAYVWFNEAANRGIPEGMMSIGYMHTRGEGVPKDNEEGLRWVRAAAKAGLPAAKTVLDLYERGSQALEDSDILYVISIDTWQKALKHLSDGDMQSVFNLFKDSPTDHTCNNAAITSSRTPSAALRIGILLQCSVGIDTNTGFEPDTESVRAAIAGILLERYGLELWKPQLGTTEAGNKVSALS